MKRHKNKRVPIDRLAELLKNQRALNVSRVRLARVQIRLRHRGLRVSALGRVRFRGQLVMCRRDPLLGLTLKRAVDLVRK